MDKINLRESLNVCKRILKAIEEPRRIGASLLLSDQKSFLQDQQRIDGYVLANLNKIPTFIYTHKVSANNDGFRYCEGLIMASHFLPPDSRVNADVDAYTKTFQTIGVKSPWTGSVANGGPYVFPNKIWLHLIKPSKPRIQ
ncbi:hypothetical protein ACTXT7_014986 [Hymenolepis weldensis]